MAQQVINLGRLRSQTGGAQRGANQIRGLLESLGRGEQIRREREDLDTITKAIAGGADITEAIASVVNKKELFFKEAEK